MLPTDHVLDYFHMHSATRLLAGTLLAYLAGMHLVTYGALLLSTRKERR